MINWLLRKTDPGVKQAHDVATVSRFVDNELTVVLGLFAVRHDRLLVLISFHFKLECGPMPNVMAALPNISGALCSTPQSLADAHYQSAVQ